MSQSSLTDSPYRNSNLFSGYYLDERIIDREKWEDGEGVEAVFEQLQSRYEKEKEVVEGQKEDALIDSWIDPVLKILGHGSRSEATLPDSNGYIDRLLFESPEARRDAEMEAAETDDAVVFEKASGLLEAKQWGASFTERFSEERRYRDASHQVKFYLERTPESVQWGILTNGKQWRLYGTNDYETQTFYEVDLPELLESGDVEKFKYFYFFFRSEAFQEVSGSTFLDTVWNESETAAQELGEDLQDNVFTALRVLGKGFVETNDLDIDPEDEAARDELKEQSLVLLYRLMFVLYAESRHLIDPDDQAAKRKYDENFSLDEKRLEILDTIGSGESFDSEYSEYSNQIWQRLQDLFALIDGGEEDLGIPAYNGGLFDSAEHEFLTENAVADRYLAEVIYRLSTTKADDGEFVLADYADLDTRHLGSIYEGLLEHEFRIAPEQYAAVSADGGQVWKPATEVSVADAVETVEEGSLYVVNDEGERKATGAYYTPDYVVTYIVEETIDPLLEEIDEELQAEGLAPSDRKYFMRYWQSVLELTILDPAMGSGHFLTKATGYLTERVMEIVRAQELQQGYDEQDLRREIAKECIYGVDLNGMAVELSKLSMWLETLSADQPLAFLDHHLKPGNSLVGSDISEILSTEDSQTGESDDSGGIVQTSVFDWMEQARQQALEQVMDLMSELLAIENDELSDIKAMEQTYAKIREDPRFTHLLEMASVHTAGQFGLEIPDDAVEQMAKALRDDSWEDVAGTDWFRSAQAMADEEGFFHWELEFPEVFFTQDGEVAPDAGFDAVVGNPPWVGIRTGILEDEFVDYLRGIYVSAVGQFDLAAVFLDKGISLAGDKDTVGFVVPKRIATNESYEELRKRLAVERPLISAIDLDVAFKGVNNDALILISGSRGDTGVAKFGERISSTELGLWDMDPNLIDYLPFSIIPVNSYPEEAEIVGQVVQKTDVRLGELVTINRGAECGMNHDAISGEKTENSLPIVDHLDVGPYAIEYSGKYIDTTQIEDSVLKSREIYETTPKLLVRFLAADLTVAKDNEGYFSTNLVYHVDCGDQVEFLSGLLSSNLLNFWYFHAFQNDEVKFPHVQKSHIASLPVPSLLNDDFGEVDTTEFVNEYEEWISNPQKSLSAIVGKARKSEETTYGAISELSEYMTKYYEQKNQLNQNILDYFGNYSDGKALPEIGFSQPPAGSAESILNETTETREKLQIERTKIERESPTAVTINLTARYKPEDEEGHDLDQYGYAETEFLPALRITDLSETEADLIEAFVPVAVEEAGGFANFRDNATKTNSLVDRLKKLTLPKIGDVEDGLESYTRTKARAEELEEKIERTDDLIDEIVYELYGLTDEEIEIVENAVGE